MPLPDTRAARQPSGGARVFADESGRQWNAAPQAVQPAAGPPREVALVFTCLSQGRVAQRAATVPPSARLDDVSDDTLRAWLSGAPRLGRLS